VHVHADKLLKTSLESLGYEDIEISIIRKRNCKKELFEYCVSAVWKKQDQISFRPFNGSSNMEEQLTLQFA
jgi:hypothetical protein